MNKALLQHMENHLVPPGAILMWSGAINDIPVGWALCDGSNGTPDLRDRFVVGAGSSYSVGNTGGAQSVTLTTAQLPAHNHTATSDTTGEHTHKYTRLGLLSSKTVEAGTSIRDRYSAVSDTSSAGAHSHEITVNNTGSGEPHENRPPYYALAYIMKL